MKMLQGFSEYKKENYHRSCFTELIQSQEKALLFCHDGQLLEAEIAQETPFDLILSNGQEPLPKVAVQACARASEKKALAKLIKWDSKVKEDHNAPILAPGERYFIKNKSLYPLMKEREVLFFTLLGGEKIKGIMTGFSRYDIEVHMKGGVAITLLRHAIFDVRNKKGRCFLKSVQKEAREWKKSELYA